jgi:ankyrin repeat protein
LAEIQIRARRRLDAGAADTEKQGATGFEYPGLEYSCLHSLGEMVVNQAADSDGPSLVELAKAGDGNAVKARLDAGESADSADRLGVSALAYAARRGDLDVLELLISHGADPNKTDSAGNSPLMEAAARGHTEAIKRLLEAGADPLQTNKWGFGPEKWADWPVNGAEIRALLRHGRD